jgi:hypothetical protein
MRKTASLYAQVQLLHPMWKHLMSTFTMIVLFLLPYFNQYDLEIVLHSKKDDTPHI